MASQGYSLRIYSVYPDASKSHSVDFLCANYRTSSANNIAYFGNNHGEYILSGQGHGKAGHNNRMEV